MRSGLLAIPLAVSLTATIGRAQSVVGTLLGVAPDGVQALSALLNTPDAVATDANGNVFVALKGSHQVVRIDPNQMVWLVAGNGALGSSGDGGPAKSASMSVPASLAVDAAGNLYIADSGLNRVRVVGSDGVIRNFAGAGQAGSGGDGGPATAATLYSPSAIAFDPGGNLYIADTGNNIIRMVTPGGTISTFAGNRGKGNGGNGGLAIRASLNGPSGVIADRSGSVYIADTGNAWIRKVTPDGMINRYAGYDPSTSSPFGGGDPNNPLNATLTSPTSLALDSSGSLYFVEYGAPRVRVITPDDSKIASYAGTGTGGSSGDGGLAGSANLNVLGICTDSHNNLIVADGVSYEVREVTAATGVINTIAGNGIASYTPRGVATYKGVLYFADSSANRIRAYNPAAGQISGAAGTGQAGFSGDTGAATSALLRAPLGIAFDGSGNLYIADTGNNRVREVYASNGTIATIAGNGTASTTGDGGLAVNATLNQPAAVAVDGSGNVYIAERSGEVVRQVGTNGLINTVAGTGIAGTPSSETGIALQQNLNLPQGLMFDASGGLLIADSGNNRIRRLTKDGNIATVAGSSNLGGNTGDGGPATSATMRGPSGVTVDSAGNLYIADTNNNTVRRVDTNGVISTVAGNGTAGYNGDGTPATAYEFSGPTSLVSGSSCNLFIADTANLRIRQLWPAVNFTVASNPPGLQVTIDGQTATAPAVVGMLPGTSHQVGAPSPQAGPAGVQYLYSGTQQINVACGQVNQALTLTFQTQYALAVATDHGGSVAPSAAGWQNAGAGVTLTATPQAGYVFSGWEGDCTGAGSCQLVMTGPKSVKADFAPSAAQNPSVPAGGVVGAGGSVPAVKALSPNGLATIYGSGFAPAGTSNGQWAANLVQGNVSTEMDGVCVLVGPARAPITYLSPGQINFQAPQGILPGTVSVSVATACGTPSQVQSAAQTAPSQTASPEFFYFLANASGQNPIAAENAVTGVYVGAVGLIPGAAFVPAKPGDIVALYATGLGLTNPPFAAGVLPGSAVWAAGSFQISVGGVTLPAANVLYAGVAPGTPGEYQINIQLPASIPDGNLPVAMTVNGYSSPAGAYITVQH
ncbi:MAG TPA: hypothetical protein VKF41_06075 [Bryobacteraceae bacterium]|nr:hypothetical protein [Bryobacteraceae bacterium]